MVFTQTFTSITARKIFFYTLCYREGDDLGVACYNEVERLIDEYGVVDEYGRTTSLENPINYGFEVYIEGELVTGLMREPEATFLITEGEYSNTQVTTTGELIYEY